MDTASAYIPIDWRHALARDEKLPESVTGAALFADISGFTPLTEALAKEHGPKRGAEELAIHLNLVYDAIVADLHRLGGSVISFSGDAITCWFDGDDNGIQATRCALDMQQTMQQFSEVRTRSGRIVSLGMKAAVAVGPVRRFVVGLPEYLLMDAMAGSTLEQMAQAESLADRGEVVITPATAAALEAHLDVAEWRSPDGSDLRYAVVTELNMDVPDRPWEPLESTALSDETQQAWLLPPVYDRLATGRGEFLSELRPAAALFMRFGGIDYDKDRGASRKLNTFMRVVQRILSRYDGSLLQLTIGDKGSYAYAAFGAPIAHEDDVVRAAAAALELVSLPDKLSFLEKPQIGITYGLMRAGAYGATNRRTYGVLGDMVNLSARLMAAAPAGEIYMSQAARELTGDLFVWEQLGDFKVKGKTDRVTVSRLVSDRQNRRLQLLEPNYRLPMVGRQTELEEIEELLDKSAAGQGQVIGLSAEAGLGKSRLAAEVIHQAYERGLVGYGGECQSYGTNSSYLVWQGVWRGFFGLDPADSIEDQLQTLTSELSRISPALLPRLPLLSGVVNLSIPDNELTRSLNAKMRKSSLEALLAECVRARARLQPMLFVLEDCHWLDDLSRELIGVIARAIADVPATMLVIYRPPDEQRLQMPNIEGLPHFTEVTLEDFTSEEAERLIELKIQAFLGDDSQAAPPEIVETITKRAAGNPFYIEEILNYLSDLGVDPRDADALSQVDLPNSIYSLILSRIDQLNERQQITIRVASVIGRLFQAAMIWGVYPELGETIQVQQDLEFLSELELTPLDTPEPELVYLFKHVMTQEVAYESLPYSLRSVLHEQIGDYIEKRYQAILAQYLDLLAFHFDKSESVEKRRYYLVAAGRAAQNRYANAAAINYFDRAIPLLDGELLVETHLSMGAVQEVVGKWDLAETHYQQALQLSQEQGAEILQAQAKIAIGELRRRQGKYDEAASWYAEARAISETNADHSGVAKALICAGTLANMQGDSASATQHYNDSLAIRREMDDKQNIANVLNNLAIVSRSTGDYVQSRNYHEEALAIRREIKNRWATAVSLNNLGNVAIDLGELGAARGYLEESVLIQREIGDKWFLANALNNLGNVVREQHDFAAAHTLYRESIGHNQALGEKWALSYLLEDTGIMFAMAGDGERAIQLAGAAYTVRQEINAPLSAVEQGKLDRKLEFVRDELGGSRSQELWENGVGLPLDSALELALDGGSL